MIHIPADVQATLLPNEQAYWLDIYQTVLAQTGDDEKATLAAWGAIRRQRKLAGRSEAMLTVPSLRMDMTPEGLPVVKGWGMLFTDPTHRDSYNTFFNDLTALMTEYYADAPLWYEHGLDIQYQFRPIGKRHQLDIYPFGIWVEHVLWPDHPQFARTRYEIETGQLAYSSDSIAHYYAIWLNKASGHVRAWPLAGFSLVKKPSEYALGPVTLDGMAAMIQEVANTPAQRTAICDGRATLTVTACQAVIFPPTDPTVAAVNLSDAIHKAREARGLHADTSFRRLSSPKEVMMDPELLQSLAEFFGVDATLDAIRGALRSLAAGEIEVDVAALRSALEMDETSSDADIVEELTAMVDLLEAEPEPEPIGTGGSLRALRTARTRALQIADHTPVPSPVPTQVPTQALRSQRGRRQFHAPNVNTGDHNPPGLVDAIMAGLGRRGPNMRPDASMAAIRADLFQMDQAARAADSGHGPSGAFVLNRELSATILEPLREQLVLEAAGATYIPMAGLDSLTIRKMVGVPGAYWAAENTEVSGDDATWATATLQLKELRAPTTWPNRWMRNLSMGAEQQILNQIIKSMRLKMEYAALFGSGGVPEDGTSTGVEPLGIRYTSGITLITLSPAATPTIEHLEAMVAGLEDNNVEETDTWRWISAPRTFRRYQYKKNQNGEPILRESWAGGPEPTLVDYQYHKTTAVPITSGAGNNASTMFFGDWAELAFGMGQDVELVVSEHRYVEKNQTFVMGVAYVDTVVSYPEAFAVTEELL